ncbi:MAG: hypothetical protein DMG78_13700 [Acidobacteria bacterium]|nr:MAG: hypothetical protein DMG78_13700 [Acidobacteriota bacterium]
MPTSRTSEPKSKFFLTSVFEDGIVPHNIELCGSIRLFDPRATRQLFPSVHIALLLRLQVNVGFLAAQHPILLEDREPYWHRNSGD